MNWLDIEIFTCNMNEFHIYIYKYIYSPVIFMNWLDIEIFAYNINGFHIYIYIYIFARDIHELAPYRDICLQYV